MAYHVRFGKIEDVEAISSEDQACSVHITNRKIQRNEIVVAEEDEELVGFLGLEYLWAQHPTIEFVRVRPESRGQGIGRSMLEFLEEHLRQVGNKALYSLSQAYEDDLQGWYRCMGFKEWKEINGMNPGEIQEVFFVKNI